MNKRIIVLFLVVLGVLLSTPAWPWDPTELPPGFVVETPGSPVELDGKTLFFLRVKPKTLSTEQRAKAVSEHLKKLAQDPSFRPGTITVRDWELSSDIMVGDQVILAVWAFEAKVEGKAADQLAREYAGSIRQAIAEYQREHSLTNLLSGIVKTVLALLVLVALIMLVNRGVRRLNQSILASERIHAVKIGEFEFFTADRIKTVFVNAVKIARFLIILLLVYVYLHLGLSFFPWTQRYALQLFNSVLGAISAIGEAIWDQTPALAFLAVLFLITRYVLKTLRYFFDQVSAGKVTVAGLDAEVAPMTYKLLRLFIIAFVAVVAYPYIPGSESPAFKGISIFLGVLFSLGSTSAIANLIAGVNLIYQRSFHVGDMIKIGEAMGMVVERKLYFTRIKTFKNHVVTIPNGTILSSHVTNLSQGVRQGDGLILHTSVTIGYDAPWKTVHALLIEAANTTSHILKRPPPFVLQTALNDFYVTYELNAYTDAPEKMPWIYGELHQNIQDKFNEGGVEIMSPHYTQLRDGNQTTIPADYLTPDYEAPAIRVTTAETRGKKDNT
ncbi:MAG: mechanosensitive ion channel family protein [Deltaproteobacteria bacterium]|nr:mechanosensitive ion channel family protein [Deltaproteobacteria bacterium]